MRRDLGNLMEPQRHVGRPTGVSVLTDVRWRQRPSSFDGVYGRAAFELMVERKLRQVHVTLHMREATPC